MVLTTEIPKAAGWYWAIHHMHGLVITNVQLVEGRVYVMDNGYSGWNPLLNQFSQWSDKPLDPSQTM